MPIGAQSCDEFYRLAFVPGGGRPPRNKRQSVKFIAFGNARLVNELRFDSFSMFLGLYSGLFGARKIRSSLIFESHDGPVQETNRALVIIGVNIFTKRLPPKFICLYQYIVPSYSIIRIIRLFYMRLSGVGGIDAICVVDPI